MVCVGRSSSLLASSLDFSPINSEKIWEKLAYFSLAFISGCRKTAGGLYSVGH